MDVSVSSGSRTVTCSTSFNPGLSQRPVVCSAVLAVLAGLGARARVVRAAHRRRSSGLGSAQPDDRRAHDDPRPAGGQAATAQPGPYRPRRKRQGDRGLGSLLRFRRCGRVLIMGPAGCASRVGAAAGPRPIWRRRSQQATRHRRRADLPDQRARVDQRMSRHGHPERRISQAVLRRSLTSGF